MYIDGKSVSTSPGKTIKDRTDMGWVKKYIEDEIARRALKVTEPIMDFMRRNKIYKFNVAGGALIKGELNDIDVWPNTYFVNPFDRMCKGKTNPKGYWEVDLTNTTKVQFCTTPVCSLEDLVNGFDFAHCKCGATVNLLESQVEPVQAMGYVHPDFIVAMALQGTFYIPNHNWPLNSLARIGKVAKKLNLTTAESKDLGNQVVSDILNQGIGRISQKDPDYAQWLKEYNV
jgi:hypothetical protein